MVGILWFSFFLGCGYAMAKRTFPRESGLVRLWAAGVFGMLGGMWGPVPFAFAFGFTFLSHVLGVVLMATITVAVMVWSKKDSTAPAKASKIPLALSLTIAAVTFFICGLLFKQAIFPRNGGLETGLAAYGDLPVHLGIITNVAAQRIFPPEDPMFAGVRLAYPFLVDTMSSSLYLLGLSLRWAMLIPGFCLAFLLVTGFVVFVREIVGRTGTTILATILFFLNGGLGFIYYVDGTGKGFSFLQRLFDLRGPTPTTLWEHNIVFWNILSNMILPQRTTLAGWSVLFFLLWLLYRAMAKGETRFFWLAGFVGGLLPMVQTAGAVVFFMIAFTWMIVYAFSARDKVSYLKGCLMFSALFVSLAAPQVLFWMVPQVTGEHFWHVAFNEINQGDPWLWFWVKNVGVVFVLVLPALVTAGARQWRFYSAAVVLFAAGESIVFAPWTPDNNKIYFIWFLFTVIIVAEFMSDVNARLKGNPWRRVLLGVVLFLATFSGALSVIHDFRTSYQVASPRDIEVADFVRHNTPADAVFLTADIHNNPVSMLAGRRIVCGHWGILMSHGISVEVRMKDVGVMYTQLALFETLRKKYHIDYVYLSLIERNKFQAREDLFDNQYPKIFSKDDVSIYAVSDRAQNSMKR